MAAEIVNVKVTQDDVFRYVLGLDTFHPLERFLDPCLFYIQAEGIFDQREKIYIKQPENYLNFQKELAYLMKASKSMGSVEILSLSEEIAEIAPTELYL